jgi:hypothetical protein
MNTLFIVAMVIQTLFGLGFIFAPGALLAPFGVTFDPISKAFANLFGSALIGFVVLLWYARKSKLPEFKMGTVYSEFIYLLISTIILLMIQLGGLMNPMGWIIVAEHSVLLVWFGYFLIKKS